MAIKRITLALLLINGLLIPPAASADTDRSWYGTYELEVRLPPGRAEGKVAVISKAILVLAKHPFAPDSLKNRYDGQFAPTYYSLLSNFRPGTNACFASVDVAYEPDKWLGGIALWSPLAFSTFEIAKDGEAIVPIDVSMHSGADLKLKFSGTHLTGAIEVQADFPHHSSKHYPVAVRRVGKAALGDCLDFAVQQWPQVQAEQKAFLEYMKGRVRQLKAQRKRQHQEPGTHKN